MENKKPVCFWSPIPSIITSSSINHIYDFITHFNFFSYIVQQQFLDLARGSTFPSFTCVKTSLFPFKSSFILMPSFLEFLFLYLNTTFKLLFLVLKTWPYSFMETVTDKNSDGSLVFTCH